MNGWKWIVSWRLSRLLAVSCFDGRYFCDCVSCSASCTPVCRCCRRALLSVACEHFECDALIVSAMTDFYCMDRIESLRRVMRLRWVALRRPQQQQRQQQTQHYDDGSNYRLIDLASMWTASVLWLWWRSSDDLTTSNKDDVISPICFFLFFGFDLICFDLIFLW